MTHNTDDRIDEIIEGFYRWCMDTITDSFKLERVLGTGKATPLKPSEAKAQLNDLLREARNEAYGKAIEVASQPQTMMFSKDVPVFNSLEEWMARVAKIREIQRQEIVDNIAQLQDSVSNRGTE